jgi:hypothetical protein
MLLLFLASLSVPPDARAQTTGFPGVLQEGEELVYNVRYGFVNLGEVRIRTVKRSESPVTVTYECVANIGSYESVPFVTLKALYQSLVDSAFFARRFYGRSAEGKVTTFSRYTFDYPNGQVVMETGTRDSVVERRDTLRAAVPLQDGLSLFFYARQNVRSGRRVNVPTVVKENKVNTYIDFLNERTTVEVDGIDYPVDVVRFEGTAEFVGLFGLTGDFEGWFSNDDARVPIQAKMKVVIGSITLDLERWKRADWAPPRAKE